MHMFVIEVLQELKYHYPAPSWHTLGTGHLQVVFFLQVYNCPVVGKESVKLTMRLLAKASQR